MSEPPVIVPEGRPSAAGGDEREALAQTISQYWALLKRYYWLLILCGAVAVTATYFWTKQQPKIYQASSKIVFHQSNPNIFGSKIERVEMMDPGGRWQFGQFWETQKQVLNSRWFAEKVVKREGLLDDPAFLPASDKSEQERLRQAAGKLLSMSTPSLVGDSRVAAMSVNATDPELAARIADAIAETYVEYTREVQSGGLSQLTNWFDNHVDTKKKELEAAQAKLQEYKRDNNILSFSYENRQNLTSSNMTSVSERLLEVRTELLKEAALLAQIREIQRGEEPVEAIADLVPTSETFDEMLAKEADLEQELAKLRTRYLDGHPRLQSVHSQLEVVRKNIDAQLQRIITSVENRVELLRRNEQSLNQELGELKAQVFQLNELGVGYNQLKGNIENLRQLYETVLSRSSELNINSMYESNIVRVLDTADIPSAPIKPNMPLMLAFGLIFGLGLGVGTVVLIDILDNTVKSPEDIARLTNKPLLAALPEVDNSLLKGVESLGESPVDTITHTAPQSSFAEGIKTLRANLMFMSPDNPPCTLLVTSPGPGEGKTISSTNMAIAMAQSGQRTLLVDADMRRPRVHKALGLDNNTGLSTVILGEVSINDAVQLTEIDNLSVLSCGEIPPNPSELLHTERFSTMLDELRTRYDRIIFDSPPLGAVSDALVLSQSVDGVLLIMKHAKTHKDLLKRALDQLGGIGAPLMGCVLNDVKPDAAGYGYSYYYYGGQYYQDNSDKSSPRLAS